MSIRATPSKGGMSGVGIMRLEAVSPVFAIMPGSTRKITRIILVKVHLGLVSSCFFVEATPGRGSRPPIRVSKANPSSRIWWREATYDSSGEKISCLKFATVSSVSR